jgi:hypothetical protein
MVVDRGISDRVLLLLLPLLPPPPCWHEKNQRPDERDRFDTRSTARRWLPREAAEAPADMDDAELHLQRGNRLSAWL